MNTITLRNVSDELLGRIKRLAETNARSVEAEIAAWFEMNLTARDVEASISEERWREIEQSLVESLNETPTDFTKEDWERLRNIARGKTTSQKDG